MTENTNNTHIKKQVNIGTKILKGIGTGIFATSYYLVAIILGISISVSLLVYGGLKIYSNTIKDYNVTQTAWYEVTNDLYNDLSVAKGQVTILYTLIDNTTEEGANQEYQLLKVSRALEEIDNAMTYSEQYELYKDIPTVFRNISNLTVNIDTENETNFNYNAIISNNKELLDNYNKTIYQTNKTISSTFGKLIAKIFSLHSWPNVEIPY